MYTHTYEWTEWYHFDNVPIESVNSWQVSHRLRQDARVEYDESRRVSFKRMIQLVMSVQVQTCTPGIVSFVL